VESTEEFVQLRLGFVDPIRWRYEVIRPLVLFGDGTVTQRTHETQTHPDTVRALARRIIWRARWGWNRFFPQAALCSSCCPCSAKTSQCPSARQTGPHPFARIYGVFQVNDTRHKFPAVTTTNAFQARLDVIANAGTTKTKPRCCRASLPYHPQIGWRRWYDYKRVLSILNSTGVWSRTGEITWLHAR
jgi:hypothetical protein